MDRKHAEFRSLITALWRHLGLPSPAFEAANEIILSVDSSRIRLAETRDGRHLGIEAEAGQLATEPELAARQVERVLAISLGRLLDNAACLHPVTPDSHRLVAAARISYRHATVPALLALVEDVLALAEFWQGELAAGRAARPQRPAPEPATLILRP